MPDYSLHTLPDPRVKRSLRPGKRSARRVVLAGVIVLPIIAVSLALLITEPEMFPVLMARHFGRFGNYQDADLSYADLRGVNLENADLRSAYLARANLSGAHLAGADLHDAWLYEARLDGADLRGATLSLLGPRGPSLWGVSLRGANLTGARLDPEPNLPAWTTLSLQKLMKDAVYDRHTRWPAGFNPELYGARRVD